jgi:hypothetical protein
MPAITKTTPTKITCIKEWQIQAALVKWARLKGLMLLSIPNGAKRSLATTMREKAIGLLPGASDLFLAHPNALYAGYWIELKVPGKKPTALQTEFMEKVKKQGYEANWFDDWVKAKHSIEDYLNNSYNDIA